MKRILSIILATVLIISLIPAVFAADEAATETPNVTIKYDIGGVMRTNGFKDQSNELLANIKTPESVHFFEFEGACFKDKTQITSGNNSGNGIQYKTTGSTFQYGMKLVRPCIAFKVYIPISGTYMMRVYNDDYSSDATKLVFVHYDKTSMYDTYTTKYDVRYNSAIAGPNDVISNATSAIKTWTLEKGWHVFTFWADSSDCAIGSFELISGNGGTTLMGGSITEPMQLDIDATTTVNASAYLSTWKSESTDATITDEVLKAATEEERAELTAYYKESTFTYSSSNPDIASVDETTGEVTAKKPGTVTITATSNEATVENTLTTQITVVDPNAPTEDPELKTAFTIDDTDDIEAAVYTDKVSALAYVDGVERTDDVTATATQFGTGAYQMTTSTTNDDYTFLYWVKGLDGGAKKVVSREASFTYTPAGNGANYLIAVYEKDGATEAKAEFYDANGFLIDTLREDGKTPVLPDMVGYGAASAWVNAKTGEKFSGNADVTVSGTMMFIAEYAEPEKNIVVTPLNDSCTVDKEKYAYGEKVVCTPTSTENFYAWKKGGNIVSVDAEKYEFYAWENCEVEAIYEAHTPLSGVARKILIDLFGNNIMAEYIGFGDAVEKGIILDNTEIAMTSTNTQFTIALDNATSAKGYAVVKNSDGTYTKYIDGSYTKQAE